MFAITADQVDSRHRADIVEETRRVLDQSFGVDLALPVDRNAGDELQALTGSARAALAVLLALDRTEQWSVGIGIGQVRLPLPRSVRAATGPAFFAARSAVDAAKRRPNRFALRSGGEDAVPAADAQALIDLLLSARARRSEAGWELHDILARGNSQRDAARMLDISESAVSLRARAAGIRQEDAAVPALARLLEGIDASEGAKTP